MSVAASSVTSSATSPNTQAIRFISFRLGIQLLFMGMAIVVGYQRLNSVYDVTLVREALWMIPIVFLLGQAWYSIRALRTGLADRDLLVSYRAFSERYWIVCATLTLVFGSLTTR